MREYAKAAPKMWHGKTMKALRRHPEALIVAMYLITSPSSNMLGLFAQPVMYMAYETGLGIEGASKGLKHCIDAGFCSYDEESEFVFVHEMASYQIAPELSPKDKQCVGIQKAYDALPENPFLEAWHDRYSAAFHLTNKRKNECGKQGAYQAPSKPHRSQEQEQEQEQENPSSLRSEGEGADAPPTPAAKTSKSKREDCTLAAFLATCREQGVKPVPEDHPIRRWAADAGVTDEMLQIAWVAFRERYTDDAQYRSKRYRDWAGHFANSVKDSWFGLWFQAEEGGALQWTSKGLLRKQALDARQAAQQRQQEPEVCDASA